MSLIYDAIKIKYVHEGYLPNYPYHLISDEEMCDAFLSDSEMCYFKDNYPLVDESLKEEYNTLVRVIELELGKLKASIDDTYTLPDWILSYMIGSVISVNSSIANIHDLLVMLGCDNLDDIFTPEAAAACYKVSKQWISKMSEEKRGSRVPTIFGDPSVIKSLRLSSAGSINT